LKTFTPSTIVPRTFPADVSAIALPVSAARATRNNKPDCVPASSRDACLRKFRRLVIVIELSLSQREPECVRHS
jgi:hypothetical protein